jgi:hypothetical protein
MAHKQNTKPLFDSKISKKARDYEEEALPLQTEILDLVGDPADLRSLSARCNSIAYKIERLGDQANRSSPDQYFEPGLEEAVFAVLQDVAKKVGEIEDSIQRVYKSPL